MWKAIIKLIEKWAYRCEHNWQLELTNNVFESEHDRRPVRVERTFICTKCLNTKKLS